MSDAVARGPVFAAVVVAAGSGTRFGRSKHDLILAGEPLWQRSVTTLRSAGIDDVVVVGDVPGGVAGGERRQDSVLRGLEALDRRPDWVLVHDAARPLISTGLVTRILDACRSGTADGVIPVVPMADTVKRVAGSHVVATLDRSELVAVQTPQAFRYGVLIAAHRSAGSATVTDDASLVELSGGTVVVVEGERSNMKITYPEDLTIAESILRGRAR